MSTPSSRAPGYYPDPASNNQIRYWNGAGWDEYHQDPTYGTYAAGHGAAPAFTGQATPWGTPPEPVGPPIPGGAPGPTPYGTPPGQPMTTLPRQAMSYSPPPRRRSRAGGVVGLAVLLAIGGAVWGFTRGWGAPPEPSGPVHVDVPVTGDVPSRGNWASALTISDPGVYWLTATSDADLKLALYDEDSKIADDDDGRPAILQTNSLDPVLMVYLDAGNYVVAVETYRTEAADAELRVTTIEDAVEVGPDPVTLTTSSEQPWFGYTADVSGSIGIDVQADALGDDLQIYAWYDGNVATNDDRSDDDPPGGEYDPYLEIDRPRGRVVFIVVPWGSSNSDHAATVTVSDT